MGKNKRLAILLLIAAGLLGYLGFTLSKSTNTRHQLAAVLGFGGTVIEMHPCIGAWNGWEGIKVLAPSAEGAIEGITTSYIVGPTPFLYYLVHNPGQFILGLKQAVSVCPTGPQTGFQGFTSNFYGDSPPGT